MKLVSMRLSKAEAKAETGPIAIKAPKFPYGLCLRLDGDQLDKLKLDDLEVGSEVTIEAKGVVEAYRESARQGRETECSAEIQITDLALGESPKARREKKAAAHLAGISRADR